MKLTDEERRMAEGYHGEGVAMAMGIMIKLGEIYGAEEMIPISSAHIDGAIYRSPDEVSLEFAERLAAGGAKVSVPTMLSMGSRDIAHWQDFKMPPSFAEGCQRMEQAYLSMGAIPIWTCAPYQNGVIPRFGEQIAWAESNAIVFANSVIGARTARYGDFADICAGIIGRVPNLSLHITANRKGDILLRLPAGDDIDFSDDAIYPVIGFTIGELAPDGIPVIEGLPKDVTNDQLKAMGAAAASSGNIALFHAVGITPEARTCEDAFQGEQPSKIIDISAQKLAEVRDSLSTTKEGKVDLVTIGCPHASFAEFEEIIRSLNGRRIAKGVEFWVTTNRVVYSWLEQTDLLSVIKKSGIKVMCDSCIFSARLINTWDFKFIVTNSAKFVNISFAGQKRRGGNVVFMNAQGCVEAACKGEVRSQ